MALASVREGLPVGRQTGPKGRRAAEAILVAAVAAAAAFPSAAQDDEGGSGEGVRKAKLEAPVVRPVDPAKPRGEPVTVILGETETERREFVVALPVGAGAKASRLAARSGTREIEVGVMSEAERYDEWVRGSLREESVRVPGGLVVLAQAKSALDVSCPGEVKAGEAVTVEIASAGDVNDAWRAWLVYPAPGVDPGDGVWPDGSRYDEQRLVAGDKGIGEKSRQTATFTTFPADRGKLLGVCIAREQGDEKLVLWVNVR